jgi:hypothetical protein
MLRFMIPTIYYCDTAARTLFFIRGQSRYKVWVEAQRWDILHSYSRSLNVPTMPISAACTFAASCRSSRPASLTHPLILTSTYILAGMAYWAAFVFLRSYTSSCGSMLIRKVYQAPGRLLNAKSLNQTLINTSPSPFSSIY